MELAALAVFDFTLWLVPAVHSLADAVSLTLLLCLPALVSTGEAVSLAGTAWSFARAGTAVFSLLPLGGIAEEVLTALATPASAAACKAPRNGLSSLSIAP